MKNIKLKNAFTILIVLYPILAIYASPIPKVSIADILLIILIIFISFYILRENDNIYNIINGKMFVFLIYIIISTLIIILIDNNLKEILFSSLRYILYIITITFYVKKFFMYDYAIKLLKKTSLIISIYIFIQFIFYYILGIVLPNIIPGLRVMGTENILINIDYARKSYLLFRPTGFFFEPSHCVQYLSIILIYYLFNFENIKNKDLKYAIITTIAIIFTGSSTGTLILFIIWGMWFFKKLRKHNILKNIKFIISFITVCILGGSILINMNFIQKSLFRLVGSGSNGGEAITGRFANYGSVINTENMFKFFFGNGINSNNEYLPGIPLAIYSIGVIGFIILFYIWIKSSIKNVGVKRIIMIIFIILNLGTAIAFSEGILLYYSLIFTNSFIKKESL
ncbi:hypothetical protein ACED96_14670 [Clostridium thermobutyricum]